MRLPPILGPVAAARQIAPPITINGREDPQVTEANETARAGGDTHRVARFVDFGSATLTFAMVALLFVLHVMLALQYPYFNQFSNVEDWAYTNIAARNYLQYGFLQTFFLQDYSASMFAADHPFVYNHMPPGPDLMSAALLALTGGDYHWTRILFGALALPGMYYYVRFIKLILGAQRIPGAALALLIAGPYIVMNHLQTEVHSVFLLLSFAPMCWLIEYNQRGGRWRMILAFAATFLLSIYIQYILLAAALFAWIFLHVFRLTPIPRRQIVLIVCTIIAGIGAHLVQNMIYLGPELFARELIYTIGNRTVGVPTQEELRTFYLDAGLVHHGAQRAQLSMIRFTLVGNLLFRFAVLILPLFLALLATGIIAKQLASRFEGFRRVAYPASGLSDDKDSQAGFILRLFGWAATTIIAVILLFPAHTQEVNLSTYGGINLLLMAVPGAALLGLLLTLAQPLLDREVMWRLGLYFPEDVRIRILTWLVIGLGVIAIFGFAGIWPLVTKDGSTRFLIDVAARAMNVLVAYAMSGGRFAVTIVSIALGIALIALSWLRFRPEQDRAISLGTHWTTMGVVTRSAFLFAALTTIAAICTRAAVEMVQISERATEPNELEPLTSLTSYKGRLFMTNINVPTIGFFAESPGYGVCGRDSVEPDGKLNRDDCKMAQMRRQKYWSGERPEIFIYFKKSRVFPGFATCWPRDAYLGVMRGGSGCNEELGERLASQYRILESNELYDVYDLFARDG